MVNRLACTCSPARSFDGKIHVDSVSHRRGVASCRRISAGKGGGSWKGVAPSRSCIPSVSSMMLAVVRPAIVVLGLPDIPASSPQMRVLSRIVGSSRFVVMGSVASLT